MQAGLRSGCNSGTDMNGPKKKSRRKFLLFAILALAAAGSGLGFYLKKREVWIDVPRR